jgi:hypothetical protein
MAKAKAKTPAKAKEKFNTESLEALGYAKGDNVETFLESFGFDADKHEVKEFCKSTWGIKL